MAKRCDNNVFKENKLTMDATTKIFSHESDSRIANVCLSICLSVHLSVCHKNPSASQNRSYQPLSVSTIKPNNN